MTGLEMLLVFDEALCAKHTAGQSMANIKNAPDNTTKHRDMTSLPPSNTKLDCNSLFSKYADSFEVYHHL
jgi:hypothetical protein